MTVKVETLNKFFGVVQSRDYRKPQCSGYGENARITFLRINMLAQTTDDDYCGIFINEVNVFCQTAANTKYCQNNCVMNIIFLMWLNILMLLPI